MSFISKSKSDNEQKYSLTALLGKISLYICPMLLGASICFSIIYTLSHDEAIPYTMMFFVMEFVLFSFFDRIKDKKILCVLIYTLLLLVVTCISVQLIYTGAVNSGDWRSPMLWFYGLDESGTKQPLYLNAVFIGGGFFIISILYYFTQVRYRTLGSMLCILFPFVIYTRRSAVMPELMITVIFVCYLAVVVHNKLLDPSQPTKNRTLIKIDRSYIITLAIFVSVIGTVTMIVRKPVYISLLEKNSSSFDYALTGDFGISRGSAEIYSRTSSQRYSANNYTGETLFYFNTDGSKDEYYLRRQSYQNFNGDVWEAEGYSSRNSYFYSERNPEYSTNDILNDMQSVLDDNNIDIVDPQNYITVRNGRVYGESFNPMYLPSPAATITDDKILQYIKYPQSIVFRIDTDNYKNSVLDDSFKFYDQTDELYTYAQKLGFKSEDYISFLLQEDTEASGRLFEDYYTAMETYTDASYVSDEITALAEQVTATAESDFEKAAALEQYFQINGYVYDDEYIPEDQSIEYFIFEGKTGVCSSYATAMTLMARGIGLPSRYVEGFAAFEKTDEGDFLIRDKYAHAFVEVYIPGAGWLTFDPTVSDYREIPEENDTSFFTRILGTMSRFLVVIIVAVFVIFSWLSDRISECFFRLRQLLRDPKQRTLRLYANVIKLINFSANGDYSSYTVKMLRDYVYSTRGVVPEKLLQLFERTAFGGYEPTNEEYRNAYAEYKKCYKYLRKIPKKK